MKLSHIIRESILFLTLTNILSANTGVDYLNFLRTAAGLPSFNEQASLITSSQNHSDYMQLNNIIGHYEDSSYLGYTGAYASDRAIYAGYFSSGVGENISYGSDSVENSIDGLFSAIYHRFAFLDMTYDEIGIGINTEFYTYNMGNSLLNQLCQNDAFTGSGSYYYNVCADTNKRIEATEYLTAKNSFKENIPDIVTWPPKNQDNIPPAFFEESPDPLPGHSVTGYPVSVEFNDAKHELPPTVDSFTLEDATEVQVTDIVLMEQSNDPNNRFSTYEHAFFPEKRLEWGSKYMSELIYTYNSVQRTLRWCFTTRSLLSYANHFYRIENDNDTTLNVLSGETYAVYVVPNDTNDKLGAFSYSYNSNAPVFSYIDQNTISISLSGNIGNYANFIFSNGQTIRLTIANTDESSTPSKATCTDNASISLSSDDFDADTISDILWRAEDVNHVWIMHEDGSHTYVNIGGKSALYTVAAIADFNADGIADILWKKGDGNYLWYMNADGSHTYKNIGGKSYALQGVADFNKDGIADILWRKDNQNHIWYMHADGSHTYKNIGTKSTLYSIHGVGDFNADGIADILWRQGNKSYIWYMHEDGSHDYKQLVSKTYSVAGISDFNKDGIDDILWRKDDQNHIWYMNADGTYTYQNIGGKSTAYTIEKTADYNGDGITDILWRAGSTNHVWIMHLDGSHTYVNIGPKSSAYSVQ